MGWIRACAVEDVYDGQGYRLCITGGSPIAVWRLHDEFFATADTCTHSEASLVDNGDLEDGMIVCGLHEAKFDMRTGEALELPATDALNTFSIKVEDGEVYVEADE